MATEVSPVLQQPTIEIRLDEMNQPIPMLGFQVFEIHFSSEDSEAPKKSLTYLTSSKETKPVEVQFYKHSKTERNLEYVFSAEIEFQASADKCWQVKDTSPNKGRWVGTHSKAIEYLEAKLNLSSTKNGQIDATSLVSGLLKGQKTRIKALILADTNLNCRISKHNFPLTTKKATDLDGFTIEYDRSEHCINGHAPGECHYDTKHARWGESKNLELELLHSSQNMPLHIAVLSGDKTMVELLVQGGASAGFKDRTGNTPLHLVCEAVYKNMRQCLVDASKQGELDVHNNNGMSPLHLAIIKSDNEFVEMLIKGGADINLSDTTGDAPIHLAVMKGNTTIISQLAKSSQLDKPNGSGLTALFLAIQLKKSSQIIDMLLEAGADPYAVDQNGKSAISEAVEKNDLTLLKKLLESRTESKTKEQSLNYALDIAEQKNRTKMMLELFRPLIKLEGANAKLHSTPEKESTKLELKAIATSSYSERICGLLYSAIEAADMEVISQCVKLINSSDFKASTSQFCKVYEAALLKTGISKEKHLKILDQVYSIGKYEQLIGGGRGSILFAITQRQAGAPNYILKFLFDWATEKSDSDMLYHSYKNDTVYSVVNEKCVRSISSLFLEACHQVTLKKGSHKRVICEDETGDINGQNMTTLKVTQGKVEPSLQESTGDYSEL